MIALIDKRIEKSIKRGLNRNRDKIINETINVYIKKNAPDEATIEELKEKLASDADHIIAILDRSVIHASMIRARYVFWITAIIGTALAVGLAAFPITTSIVPFFVPLMVALVGWAVAVGTIPLSYIQSVKGVLDASVLKFEKDLQEKLDHPEMKIDAADVMELQVTVRALQEQVAALRVESNQNRPLPSTIVRGATLWQSSDGTEDQESTETLATSLLNQRIIN